MNKKTLVLGASDSPNRYSYHTIKRLVANNHEVKAIGGKKGEVGSVKIGTNQEKFQDIDTVTIYLNKRHQPKYYEYIIDLNPKRVLFNPGTQNTEFEKLLTEKKIDFERACTLVLLSINQY
jgi:predicted CoA-binding protein